MEKDERGRLVPRRQRIHQIIPHGNYVRTECGLNPSEGDMKLVKDLSNLNAEETAIPCKACLEVIQDRAKQKEYGQ